MPTSSSSDAKILSLLREKASFEQGVSLLVKTYREKIYWQIRRMVLIHEDADDLTQEVFLRAISYINHFRGDSSLATWLYRIAINHTYNFIKSEKKKRIFSSSNFEEDYLQNLSADPYFNTEKVELDLQRAILSLPEKQRTVFLMKYYDEMPYEKMSAILDTSVGALKSSFHIASKKIESFLLQTTENPLDSEKN